MVCFLGNSLAFVQFCDHSGARTRICSDDMFCICANLQGLSSQDWSLL